MGDVERALAHCTAHDAYTHDCPWCVDAENQVARATRTNTAEVMAANLRAAVSAERERAVTLVREAADRTPSFSTQNVLLALARSIAGGQ